MTADDLAARLLGRRPGYLPRWTPPPDGPDTAVLRIVSRYAHLVLQRLQQAPEKHRLAFLDRLGISQISARSARAPIVFHLTEGASDAIAPAGTRVAAPPPPGSSKQLVFETERQVGLAAARLTDVVSLWPGRDQFVDDSSRLASGTPFTLFERRRLSDTPHALYIAHDTLLALAGRAQVDVELELTQGGSEPLRIDWEYWDGQVWRGFANTYQQCGAAGAAGHDGTRGLQRSGRVHLEAECAETSKTTVAGIEGYWLRGRLSEPLPPLTSRVLPEVEAIRLSTSVSRPLGGTDPRTGLAAVGLLSTDRARAVATPPTVTGGFLPEKAFVDATAVDLTRPFLVFGPQPQPGAVFYLMSREALSKPGARLEVYVESTTTPQDELDAGVNEVPDDPIRAIAVASRLPHTVSWEYWNGRAWTTLLTRTATAATARSAEDFTATGIVELEVPDDALETAVNGQKGQWLRVRLLSGSFGFKHDISWVDAAQTPQRFTNVIVQPPAVSALRLGYTWTHGPFRPQHVVTHNDFAYEDVTEEAIWPGRTFLPFTSVVDATPALYLGYDQALPVDLHGLYFDIVEASGGDGPALAWEYWNGIGWRPLSVADETGGLRRPGIVSFIAAPDSRAVARFGTPRHWVRARLKEDGPPEFANVIAIHANAVWAVQRQLILEEPLGISTGQPNQSFTVRQPPLLAGEVIEVREVSGLRAAVEWRLIARDVLGDDAAVLRTLESQLAHEGPEPDVTLGDLRLRRDRQKRVAEVWVRWHPLDRLVGAEAMARRYTADRVTGRLQFGDGRHGRIPPIGAALLARRYHTGGGLAGNVAARSITQAQSAIPGLDKLFNPRAAEGGADAESLDRLARRGPRTLRRRGRAIDPGDYEVMAYEASPAIAVAHALPGTNDAGRRAPGWVTVVIIPESLEPRPQPSFGLREQVRQYIEGSAAGELAGAGRIHIAGPRYLPVDVEASVVVREGFGPGEVERTARTVLQTFLHPLRGGAEGRGWPMGRDVHASDVESLLERVEGIDHVARCALLLDGVPVGARVAVGGDRTVVAGEIRLKLS